MPGTQHGLAPDRSSTVVLILDMISDYRFPQAGPVLRAAKTIAPRIARLKARAHAAGLAVCYVNDNPGRWRSDLTALLADTLSPRARGADVVELLKPGPKDYFVLKPRHSAFYATPLDALLSHWHARRLILTGVSSHQCVLFTANDAHVRNFEIVVPRDCIGAPSAADTRFAVKYFKTVLKADTALSSRLRLKD